MAGLPKLPGTNFQNPTFTKFHLPHKFNFINGYRMPIDSDVGPGGRELEANSVKYIDKKDSIKFDPSLTYGRVRSLTAPQYIPHFAHYDKKCITFKAFFKQSVVESPLEHYRIRQVNIIYFLEDDTITVMEPKTKNPGFMQGRLVSRSKIPKTNAGDFWHWKDLNVGIDICLYSIVYHTVDCDTYTREYMASQGIVINPTEDMPPDPYTQRLMMTSPQTTRVTPSADDKLRRFLEYDGKVLKFNAAWDNRDSEYGELKEYVVLYFLSDDTVTVKEVHKGNDGCDPVPLLLRKTKLPKNWKDRPMTYPSVYMELSDAEVTEYYQPKDFLVGETIFILGRRFLLYDCDKFTKDYFSKILHIEQKPAIQVFDEIKPKQVKVIPPHEGLPIGSLEDSMQNCFQTIPKRPRKDEVRILLNNGKYLRYTMELDWVHPEDSIRKFLLLYSLSLGTVKIYEPPIINSGIIGGKFLRDMLIEKANTDPLNPEYYTPADFYIGAKIDVFGHRFIITGADLCVYRYMQANPEKFSQEVIDNIRNYMYTEGYLESDIKAQITTSEEQRKKDEIEKIGKELEVVKTERQKCIEDLVQKSGSDHVTIQQQLTPVLDSEGRPIEKQRYVVQKGIKPVSRECPYPVIIGELQDGSCNLEGGIDSELKYPDTKEDQLRKYYESVLKRHEEVCLKAREYKKTNECLPGTVFKKTDDKELSKYVLRSKEDKPQPDKLRPCKKTVRFVEPLDKYKQEKEDICNLKPPRDTCNCTEYHG